MFGFASVTAYVSRLVRTVELYCIIVYYGDLALVHITISAIGHTNS